MNTTESLPTMMFMPCGTPEEVLLAYPGNRVEGNHLVTGEQIVPLTGDYTEFVQQVNEFLVQRALPSIEERVPVLAYGSNANPWKLQQKLVNGGLFHGKTEELTTIPCFEAEVSDVAVVWHGRTGQTGSLFAELYSGEEAKGVKTRVGVQFMTAEQLAIIHATEGATYGVVQLPVSIDGQKEPLNTYAYVALDASILLKDGRPLAVSGREPDGHTLESATAERAVSYILTREGVVDRIGKKDPKEFVQEGLQLSLPGRKERQLLVADGLDESGNRYSFDSTGLRTYGRLAIAAMMGQEDIVMLADDRLRGIRPTQLEIRALAERELSNPNLKVLKGENRESAALRVARRKDPMTVLRQRATDEIAARLRRLDTGQ